MDLEACYKRVAATRVVRHAGKGVYASRGVSELGQRKKPATGKPQAEVACSGG